VVHERREYEETICNRTKGDADDLVISVKSSFDESLLRMWCRLRWNIPLEDVTGEHILAEMGKIVASVKNDSIPDVDREVRKKLSMDLSESNISERVIQYFRLCDEIIDEQGWRQFFEGENGMNQYCRILEACLTPRALREDVERAVKFKTPSAMENEVLLHDVILKMALAQEDAHQRHLCAKRHRSNCDVDQPSGRGTSKQASKKQRAARESIGSGPRATTKPSVDHPNRRQRHALTVATCIGCLSVRRRRTNKRRSFDASYGLSGRNVARRRGRG
jgi:hypothetical protein